MSYRALALLLALAPEILLRSQSIPVYRGNPANPNTAALQGRVLNPEGQPLAGIHIALNEPATALPVTSTFTQPDGSFEMYNIPKGEYEIVAESSDAEVSNLVSVDRHVWPRVELRFSSPALSRQDIFAVASVSQMMAPEKAQRLYANAREAFRRGDSKQATNFLQQALRIEPHYADALTLQGLIDLPDADPHVPQQSLEQALRLNPSDSSALIALSALYNRQSRFEDALRLAQRAASLAPKSWQARLEIAKAFIAKNLFVEGLLSICQAERLGGTRYAEVHLIKAYGLFHLKSYSASKYEAETAIAHDRGSLCTARAQSLLSLLDGVATLVADVP